VSWGLLKRKTRSTELAGRALYAAAAEQARRPDFYTALRVEDTANGRFELYSLHVVLLLRRLKGGGEAARETAQALFDAYVGALDEALREQGVGDLSMAKKMRKLGEAFYGRVRSYDEAFDALPDGGPVETLVGRTVYADQAEAPAAALTRYVVQALERLAGEADERLLEGRVSWPEITA
jgi:cytochrome b pre-mRNA-processing protein 3